MLGVVDFTKVVHITPKKAESHPADLMLPVDRLAEQQAGGTWSALFNTQALHNRFQPLGVVVWYLAVFLLGLAAYPLVRLALPGVADRGYPLARVAGLLILAYLVWLGGSLRMPVSRLTITIAFLLMAGLGIWLAYRQRDDLREEWREGRRYFLLVEGLFLAFFLFDLLIRLGNPDLWHQWKGGEKPMDFAYFNAILKSTTFPPYDPWFAGGYLNYYYYGFVLVGVLVKWLGIVPAIAYNLILPTLFSMIALGAFSVAWNIFAGWRAHTGNLQISNGHWHAPEGEAAGSGSREEAAQALPPPAINLQFAAEPAARGLSRPEVVRLPAVADQTSQAPAEQSEVEPARRVFTSPPRHLPSAIFHLQIWVALSAALAMAVIGNLGTVRMILQGYQRLGSPTGVLEGAAFPTRTVWAVRGFFDALGGETLPYGVGDWYWNPSRVIPPQGDVEPITEFPFFTVLYADPHAHLFALPVALLALGWVVSVMMARGRWKGIAGAAAGFGLGGLAIGALYPINLSDMYTYLPLGIVALAYTLWRYFEAGGRALSILPPVPRRLVLPVGGVVLLVGLAFLLYRPYTQWYGQPYSSVGLWPGPLTPLSSYLTHWGLFLFVIVAWMIWETREWLASTPLSALRKLEPYRELIFMALIGVAGAILILQGWAITRNHWHGASIAWLALPLAAWAGVLLLRPGQADAKRLVLFLVGTGLLITIMVEVVVVKGDIGRMNTVFKFYLQVWTLYSVSAAAALGWLLAAMPGWLRGWRTAWQVTFAMLVFSAFLFPLLGGIAKIKDRMVESAPHTLDGMAYMEYAAYDNWGIPLDLNQDYHAIRWMQENVSGSPVIVEAGSGGAQYQWYSRYSIYTGLPTVIGWQWHQMQQRELLPDPWVLDRDMEVESFYTNPDPEYARAFLRKYNARYVILGQLERGRYAGLGLAKFAALEGVLWRQVYGDRETAIYEIIPPAGD
jgi:YYY domain-containing protein